MSKSQTLRGLINQRLSAAAEEIFELFERTIAEYEEQLCRSKEDQHKHLDPVYNPEVRLHRADVQLLVIKEEVPSEHQVRSSSLDQELPPELPHIKEEQEDLWSIQEREQLHGLEEADISTLIFTPVPAKSEEDDGEKAQSSQLHETEESRETECLNTEADQEDCGGSGADRSFVSDRHIQPVIQEKTLHSSERDSRDSSYVCTQIRIPQSGLNPLSEMRSNAGKTSLSPLAYALSFGRLEQLQQKHASMEMEEKPFSCTVCGKRFSNKKYLQKHTIRHTEERRFSCSVCEKTFLWRVELVRHMRTHTKEKPLTCHICGLFFKKSSMLAYHLKHHADTDHFTCSVCNAGFSHREAWDKHMEGHNGETPLTCLTCGKTFSERGNLKKHLRVHTGEKPFSCSLCEKQFTWSSSFKSHRCCSKSS